MQLRLRGSSWPSNFKRFFVFVAFLSLLVATAKCPSSISRLRTLRSSSGRRALDGPTFPHSAARVQRSCHTCPSRHLVQQLLRRAKSRFAAVRPVHAPICGLFPAGETWSRQNFRPLYLWRWIGNLWLCGLNTASSICKYDQNWGGEIIAVFVRCYCCVFSSFTEHENGQKGLPRFEDGYLISVHDVCFYGCFIHKNCVTLVVAKTLLPL